MLSTPPKSYHLLSGCRAGKICQFHTEAFIPVLKYLCFGVTLSRCSSIAAVNLWRCGMSRREILRSLWSYPQRKSSYLLASPATEDLTLGCWFLWTTRHNCSKNCPYVAITHMIIYSPRAWDIPFPHCFTVRAGKAVKLHRWQHSFISKMTPFWGEEYS